MICLVRAIELRVSLQVANAIGYLKYRLLCQILFKDFRLSYVFRSSLICSKYWCFVFVPALGPKFQYREELLDITGPRFQPFTSNQSGVDFLIILWLLHFLLGMCRGYGVNPDSPAVRSVTRLINKQLALYTAASKHNGTSFSQYVSSLITYKLYQSCYYFSFLTRLRAKAPQLWSGPRV